MKSQRKLKALALALYILMLTERAIMPTKKAEKKKWNSLSPEKKKWWLWQAEEMCKKNKEVRILVEVKQ